MKPPIAILAQARRNAAKAVVAELRELLGEAAQRLEAGRNGGPAEMLDSFQQTESLLRRRLKAWEGV